MITFLFGLLVGLIAGMVINSEMHRRIKLRKQRRNDDDGKILTCLMETDQQVSVPALAVETRMGIGRAREAALRLEALGLLIADETPGGVLYSYADTDSELEQLAVAAGEDDADL